MDHDWSSGWRDLRECTFEDAFYAPLPDQVLTQAIGTDRTIVIQTADFRIFKIGNAYFDFYYWRYHFDYVELTP